MQKLIFGALFTIYCTIAQAQLDKNLQIRNYRIKQETIWMDEYRQFLSIPNLASDSLNLQKNAAFIQKMMAKRGIKNIQLLHANTANTAPVVYGEAIHPGSKLTLIFYAHYDGQPVDTTKWAKGLSAFQPRIFDGSLEQNAKPIAWPDANTIINPEWRIYARGASAIKPE